MMGEKLNDMIKEVFSKIPLYNRLSKNRFNIILANINKDISSNKRKISNDSYNSINPDRFKKMKINKNNDELNKIPIDEYSDSYKNEKKRKICTDQNKLDKNSAEGLMDRNIINEINEKNKNSVNNFQNNSRYKNILLSNRNFEHEDIKKSDKETKLFSNMNKSKKDYELKYNTLSDDSDDTLNYDVDIYDDKNNIAKEYIINEYDKKLNREKEIKSELLYLYNQDYYKNFSKDNLVIKIKNENDNKMLYDKNNIKNRNENKNIQNINSNNINEISKTKNDTNQSCLYDQSYKRLYSKLYIIKNENNFKVNIYSMEKITDKYIKIDGNYNYEDIDILAFYTSIYDKIQKIMINKVTSTESYFFRNRTLCQEIFEINNFDNDLYTNENDTTIKTYEVKMNSFLDDFVPLEFYGNRIFEYIYKKKFITTNDSNFHGIVRKILNLLKMFEMEKAQSYKINKFIINDINSRIKEKALAKITPGDMKDIIVELNYIKLRRQIPYMYSKITKQSPFNIKNDMNEIKRWIIFSEIIFQLIWVKIDIIEKIITIDRKKKNQISYIFLLYLALDIIPEYKELFIL